MTASMTGRSPNSASVHVRLGRHNLVRQLFVRGQLADERQDERHVSGRRRPDLYLSHDVVFEL